MPFVGPDAPDSPTDGMLWWDTSEGDPDIGLGVLQGWSADGEEWILVGPPIPGNALYEGNDVTVAPGSFGENTPLTWDTKMSGAALLDISTPTQPAIVTQGVYAVSINILVDDDGLTVGTNYNVHLGFSTPSFTADLTSPIATAAFPTPGVLVSTTKFFAANERFGVSVSNFDS